MVSIPSTETPQRSKSVHIPRMVNVLVSFLRPNDATPYAGGDVVTDTKAVLREGIEFPNCAARRGGSGAIHSARVSYDDNVVAENFELLIFRAMPVGQQDGQPLALFNNDVGTLVGIVRFDGSMASPLNAATRITWSQKGFAAGLAADLTRLPFTCEPDTASLWGLLVCRAGHTPAAQRRVYLELGIEQT